MKFIYLTLGLLFFHAASFAQLTALNENFSTCISVLPGGWTSFNVSGADEWQCNTSGYSGAGVSMNGYSTGSYHANQDWLISPQLNVSAMSNPIFSFRARTKYNGNSLALFLSQNYSGSGDPNLATWIPLPANFPPINSDAWTLVNGIALQAYASQNFYLAFRYTSTNTAAAYWCLDDCLITDDNLQIEPHFINTHWASSLTPGNAAAFHFTCNAISTNFQLDVAPPFELSKDGLSFSQQIQYTPSSAGIAQTAYVRIHPTQNQKVYRSAIQCTLNGIHLSDSIFLLGTSLPDSQTLKVFTWNMRWFGDPINCACDTAASRQNAVQLFQDIDADLYCLQEVVANNEIAAIANALGPNYQYLISPFGSFANSPADPDYASAQKLAFIYNTHRIQHWGDFGLLYSTIATDTSTNSGYYCFSSGRFPYVLQASLTLSSNTKDTIIIANLHAKAISDIPSYNRRQCAATKMTDSLNALFPGKKVLVIGDYNDYLEGTDVSGLTVSPYDYLLQHGYTGITLPSKFPNQTTYIVSANHIIDNIACSQPLYAHYPDSSCFIMNEVAKYIPNYDINSSDHLPLMTYFQFQTPNAVADIKTHHGMDIDIKNPSNNTLRLSVHEDYEQAIVICIRNLQGQPIETKQLSPHVQSAQYYIPQAKPGLYLLDISDKQQHIFKKWLVK